MSTPLKASMTAGVLVECLDAEGHLLGQAVFTGWQGRPLPMPGDAMVVTVHAPAGQRRKLRGQVRTRQFEVQQQDGQPSVWVRIELLVGAAKSPSHALADRAWFSKN